MKFPTALLSLAAALCALPHLASAKIQTKTVEYKEGDTPLEGFLAYDDAATQPRPGILVVHDWTGMGPYVQQRVEQLAGLGYVAFAPDIYGKAVRPKSMQEFGPLAGKYKNDIPLFRRRLEAGLKQLTENPHVAAGQVAVMGYCFGGTGALELARDGAPLKGVVTFHGGLSTKTPQDAKNIHCPVLILHGADDPFVKPEEVAAFKQEMEKAGVKYHFVAYPGAVHAFTRKDAGDDNSKGAAYNAAADAKSWEEMKKFFAEIFPKS